MALTLTVTYCGALDLWEVGRMPFDKNWHLSPFSRWHETPEEAVEAALILCNQGVVYRYGPLGLCSGPPLFPEKGVHYA